MRKNKSPKPSRMRLSRILAQSTLCPPVAKVCQCCMGLCKHAVPVQQGRGALLRGESSPLFLSPFTDAPTSPCLSQPLPRSQDGSAPRAACLALQNSSPTAAPRYLKSGTFPWAESGRQWLLSRLGSAAGPGTTPGCRPSPSPPLPPPCTAAARPAPWGLSGSMGLGAASPHRVPPVGGIVQSPSQTCSQPRGAAAITSCCNNQRGRIQAEQK